MSNPTATTGISTWSDAWRCIPLGLDDKQLSLFYLPFGNESYFLPNNLFSTLIEAKKSHLQHFLAHCSRTDSSVGDLYQGKSWTVEDLLLPFFPGRGSLPVKWQLNFLPPGLDGPEVRGNTTCIPSGLFWCALLTVVGFRSGFDSVNLKNTLQTLAVWQTGASKFMRY